METYLRGHVSTTRLNPTIKLTLLSTTTFSFTSDDLRIALIVQLYEFAALYQQQAEIVAQWHRGVSRGNGGVKTLVSLLEQPRFWCLKIVWIFSPARLARPLTAVTCGLGQQRLRHQSPELPSASTGRPS